MAGRRGDILHPDRVLLPMSFQEFCRQLEFHRTSLSPEQKIKAYLEVGGFPFRVEKYLELSKTRQWDFSTGFQVFDDVFFYEFVRRKLDRTIALEVVGRLASIECTAISYEAFVKPLTLARETARKYLDALGDAFLLATVSSYDTSRGRVAHKKGRKFCWIDPALGFLGTWLKQGSDAKEASRAEWTVGAELLRRYESRLWEGPSSPCNIFTWKSSGGNEVDYLIVDKSKKVFFPVEVKYQSSISDWDVQVMERAFGRGWLVTPSTNKLRPKTQMLSLDKFFTHANL